MRSPFSDGRDFLAGQDADQGRIDHEDGRTHKGVSLPRGNSRFFDNAETVLETKRPAGAFILRIPKSFRLKKGELLGWYGLVGAGRTEFARELIGYDPAIEGEQYINGKKVKAKSILQTQTKYKICYLSENRKEEGLFLDHSVKNNITSTILKKMVKGPLGISST